jgi:hypothetical protein
MAKVVQPSGDLAIGARLQQLVDQLHDLGGVLRTSAIGLGLSTVSDCVLPPRQRMCTRPAGR